MLVQANYYVSAPPSQSFVLLSEGKAIMIRVAEEIPKLKTRTQKTGGGDQAVQQGEGGKKSKKKKK